MCHDHEPTGNNCYEKHNNITTSALLVTVVTRKSQLLCQLDALALSTLDSVFYIL